MADGSDPLRDWAVVSVWTTITVVAIMLCLWAVATILDALRDQRRSARDFDSIDRFAAWRRQYEGPCNCPVCQADEDQIEELRRMVWGDE